MTSYRWPKKTSNPSPYLGIHRGEEETDMKPRPRRRAPAPTRKRELKGAIANHAERNQRPEDVQLPHRRGRSVHRHSRRLHEGRRREGGRLRGRHSRARQFIPRSSVMSARRIKPAKLRCASRRKSAAAASPMNRPVSDLKVSYLIFPGTADTPWGPPDFEKIHARCEALVKEIGGAGVPLHKWEDIIPTPTPTPTPTAYSQPSPTPSPGFSVARLARRALRPRRPSRFHCRAPSPSLSPSPTATPSPSASAVVRRQGLASARCVRQRINRGGVASAPSGRKRRATCCAHSRPVVAQRSN